MVESGGSGAALSGHANVRGSARRRLIIATNRGPVTFSRTANGHIIAERGPGGLVTALLQVALRTDFTWLATPVSDLDRIALREEAVEGLPVGLKLKLVSMPEATYHAAYDGIATRLFYFFQHRLFDLATRPSIGREMHDDWRSGFRGYARSFGTAINSELRSDPKAVVMLHDPHMYLVAPVVRRRNPTAILTHFTGIPWPEARELALLPKTFRTAILRGLLANDIVGFQTRLDAAGFREAVRTYVPDATGSEQDRVTFRGRPVGIRAYPISIDPEVTRQVASSPEAELIGAALLQSRQRIVARIDRLDPSKNVLRGFQAFHLLMSEHPELVGSVRFVAVLPPSRAHLEEYRAYARQVEAETDQINQEFGRPGLPAVELFRGHDYARGLATLAVADVVLVNSLADGMNLVAKEAVAVSRRNAVLVVSESTGAFAELGRYSLGVSATDVAGTADAMYLGLTMPESERSRRMESMRQHLEHHDLSRWLRRQLSDVDAITRHRHLTAAHPTMEETRHAEHRR